MGSFRVDNIKVFKKDYSSFLSLYSASFTLPHHSTGRKILFHAAAHMPDFVIAFGNPKNFSSDSMEMAHGPLTKTTYLRTQRQSDAPQQILRILRRFRVLNEIESRLEKKDSESKRRQSEPKEVRKSSNYSIPDIIPLTKIKDVIASFLKRSGILGFDTKKFQYELTDRVHDPIIGRIVACESFGKWRTDNFPYVFILPPDSSYDIKDIRLNSELDLCKLLHDEKLFLGQIYSFVHVKQPSVTLALFTHFEKFSPKYLLHETIKEPFVKLSIDKRNETLNGRQMWWDACSLSQIIRKT